MKEVVKFVQIFFNSFDTKDWKLMKNCLTDKLELDYESFRGTPKYISSSDDYVSKRKTGLKNLNTAHQTFNYIIDEYNGEFKCQCDFEIKRHEVDSIEYFHSFGAYEIWIKKIGNNLKIFKIKQNLKGNEGNKAIHGAFRI